MPAEGIGTVRGSVIQRSLIPDGLSTVLNVATVPVHDLMPDSGEPSELRGLLAHVLGISETAILDAQTYVELRQRIRNGRFFRPRGPFAPFWSDYYDEFLSRQARGTRLGEGPTAELATDALALMVRPPTLQDGGFFPPFWEPDAPGDAPEETVDLALRCCVASGTRNQRVLDFLTRIGEYDIPSGQSPKAKNDSLLKLIQSSGAVCLAPLPAGSVIGISHLNQGQFVAALQSTGTAAAMTLMLIGTVSVADYLVHYMVHRRKPRPPDPTPPGGKPPKIPQSPREGKELQAGLGKTQRDPWKTLEELSGPLPPDIDLTSGASRDPLPEATLGDPDANDWADKPKDVLAPPKPTLKKE